MRHPSSPDHPLHGLRVLDLSRVLAGPYAGRLLSDLGADVVKVEPPAGDITRLWGHVRGGLSGFYTQQNAGKRNVGIDLKRPGGPELVRRLADCADFVIENFRPGVLARSGLGYADLSARNPRLIMLSISGFGQQGPERDRPAYAPVIHAEAGYISRHSAMNGEAATDPIFSIADSTSGLHGLVALLSALHMRERTGRGQHIDLAMLRALVATDDYTHHLLDDALPPERLGGHVFDAPGGRVLISAQWKYLWHAVHERFGVEADAGSDLAEKIRNRESSLRRWVAEHPDRGALARNLDELGIAFGDVREMDTVFDSPTLRQDGVVEEVSGDDGARRVINSPYRFSDAAAGVRGPAPHQGQHNAEVLSDWLALNAAEIGQLARKAVLYGDDAGTSNGTTPGS